MFFITPIPSSIVIAPPSQKPDSDSQLAQNQPQSYPNDTESPQSTNPNAASSPSTQQTSSARSNRAKDPTSLYQPQAQYIHPANPDDPQNSKLVLQQPQYSTAMYAQQIARAGLPVSHMMSTQIQPPSIQIGDSAAPAREQNGQNSVGNSSRTFSSSASAVQLFATINSCVLNPDDPVGWINAMRQVLMALFQLMLLAVQRGV